MANKEPYGDVAYADPGYRADKVKRYALNTEERVRAAWAYINMPKNAKFYTAAQLARIKARIKAAAKRFGIKISDDRSLPMTVLTRAYASDLEVRDDGRTLYGTVVPYGVEVTIGHYRESFATGAFAGAADVVLTATHPHSDAELPIGVSVELRDDGARLHGDFHVSETDLGNQVLTLVRDRVPLGLSVGFIELPGGDRWNRERTRVVRTRAALDHVAVVRAPAYPQARIAGLRGVAPGAAPLLRLAQLRSL